MRAVRAILGRFARFLVRIARTLDPDLAAAPYWVMPERMAALRRRFPGAPEHWLELVARRTIIAEAPESTAPERAVGRSDHDSSSRAPLPEPHSTPRGEPALPKSAQHADRPSVRFPRPALRSHAPAGPISADRRHKDRAPAALPPDVGKAARPELSLHPSRARNPIANLLRLERRGRRSAMPQFDFEDQAARDQPDAPAQDESDGFARRPTVFPDEIVRDGRRPDSIGEWHGPRDAASDRQDARWPALAPRAAVEPSWPDATSGEARPGPRFATDDNRWPDLPALPEAFAPLPGTSHDEAALLAEQIGGTWSA